MVRIIRRPPRAITECNWCMATLTYTFKDIKGTLEDEHIICRNCGNKHYVKYKQDILKGWGKPSAV